MTDIPGTTTETLMSILKEAQDLFVKSPPGGEAAAGGGDPNLRRELTIDEVMFFLAKAGMASGELDAL
jgi:hypothetical protein